MARLTITEADCIRFEDLLKSIHHFLDQKCAPATSLSDLAEMQKETGYEHYSKLQDALTLAEYHVFQLQMALRRAKKEVMAS